MSKIEHFKRSNVASVELIDFVGIQDRQAKTKRNASGLNGNGHATNGESNGHSLSSDQTILQDLIIITDHSTLDRLRFQRPPREILRGYSDTDDYSQKLREIRRLKAEGYSDDEIRETFVGAVFEDIGERFYRDQLQEGILLGKEATDRFFQHLYPDRLVVEHEFERRALAGITVPDGLVVTLENNSPQITRFVDYSVTQDPNKYRNQYFAYETGVKRMKRSSPGLLADSFSLDYVVPFPSREDNYPRMRGKIPMTYTMVGFDSKDFARAIDQLTLPHLTSNSRIY